MYTLLTVIIILTSILLGAIILVQSSKGGGLAAGLSSSNQVMGVRKTTEGLEKLTWGFGGGLMLLVLLASFSLPSASQQGTATAPQNQSTTLERAAKTNVPQQQAPVQPQQQTQPATTAAPAK